jgi:ubiquinone/menaquinone biosynthesis C-methylase UbiE
MSKSSAITSRKERVVAQYNSSDAAIEYARANSPSRAEARYTRSRLWLVQRVLEACPGGDLLDAGSGPGLLADTLLKSRPDNFRITVLDRSFSMVEYCMANIGGIGEIHSTVGELEALPFADAIFDVTLVMGALEYADPRATISQVSRVTRPGGLVIVTMLNPMSLYRFIEWFVYWPARRVLAEFENAIRVPEGKRHGVPTTGIRAFPSGSLKRIMEHYGLRPIDCIYYDLRLFPPPADKLRYIVRNAERITEERTITRGWCRWMGTGYLVAARRL